VHTPDLDDVFFALTGHPTTENQTDENQTAEKQATENGHEQKEPVR